MTRDELRQVITDAGGTAKAVEAMGLNRRASLNNALTGRDNLAPDKVEALWRWAGEAFPLRDGVRLLCHPSVLVLFDARPAEKRSRRRVEAADAR